VVEDHEAEVVGDRTRFQDGAPPVKLLIFRVVGSNGSWLFGNGSLTTTDFASGVSIRFAHDEASNS
jgi:hypothetical protein